MKENKIISLVAHSSWFTFYIKNFVYILIRSYLELVDLFLQAWNLLVFPSKFVAKKILHDLFYCVGKVTLHSLRDFFLCRVTRVTLALRDQGSQNEKNVLKIHLSKRWTKIQDGYVKPGVIWNKLRRSSTSLNLEFKDFDYNFRFSN